MGRSGRIGDIQPFAELARSPTTIVYKGYQAALDRFVLLKVLTPGFSHDADLVRRFEAEARLLAKVQHPNVVAIYAFGEADGQAYLAAEFIDGQSLAERLDAGPLPPPEAAALLADAARGLQAAHDQGILHRDLKPANILLSATGELKLADFGMASLDAAEDDEVRGTFGYLAPEQILGARASRATDLFALGATFAEMVTGRPAFPGADARARLDAALHHDPGPSLEAVLPPPLRAIAAKLLAKDPADRYPDAAAALADLQTWDTAPKHNPPAAKHPSGNATPEASRRPPPAARRMGIAGLAAVLVVALATVWGMSRPAPLPNAPVFSDTVRRTDDPVPSRRADAAQNDLVTDTLTDEGPNAEINPATPTRDDATPQAARSVEVTPSRDASPSDALPPDGTAPAEAERTVPAVVGPGTLRVNSSPWAVVYVDGDSVGTTPLADHPLAAGAHRLVLRHPEEPAFPEHAETIEVVPGAAVVVNVSLWGHVGRLALVVSPWAEVWLDGVYRDTTPLGQPLILSPGPHTLTLKHPQLGERTAPIRVAAGAVDTLRFTLAAPTRQ